MIVAPLVTDDAEVELADDDLRIDTYRASDASGQHVNKTDSAVRITHIPTGIVVQCQNERSQSSNKQTALRCSDPASPRSRRRSGRRARAREAQISSSAARFAATLHPYQMVKDHRTEHETGNTDAVLDGDLDSFIQAYLLEKAAGKVV